MEDSNYQSLENDSDIQLEASTLENFTINGSVGPMSTDATMTKPVQHVPLFMDGNTYMSSQQTAQLLRSIGGASSILKMTNIFYKKCFQNSQIDKFIANHNDPHFLRLGNWICEKMDSSNPVWTTERSERSKCPLTRTLGNGQQHLVQDRTSAHYAAWNSHKRPSFEMGEHFSLHDARGWMRLMFWSAREAGLFEQSPVFEEWYVRFIAHFVRVYEREAPKYARESLRWSSEISNLDKYLTDGCLFGAELYGNSGRGLSKDIALRQLPLEESNDFLWPYSN